MPWLTDDASQLAPTEHRSAGHAAGVVGAAAGDGSRTAQRHRRQLPAARRRPRRSSSTSPTARCASTPARTTRFRFDIQRELVETVVAQRAVDWSNALFLSCRFRAWRAGAFNEYLYNFFKSLSPERMRRAEAEARQRLDPLRSELAGEEIRIGDYIVERLCPHRQADLSVFGEIDDGELVCTLHGWRFDLETGRCFTANDRSLRIRRARRRLTRFAVPGSSRQQSCR